MAKPYHEMTPNQRANEAKRIDAWRKENTKTFIVRLKPEIWERIDNYCKHYDISKAEFLRRAIQELD